MAIRYDKKFNNEINKIVRAYNAKINRLSKKDENYVFRTTKSNGEISEDTIRVTDDDIDKILNVKVDTEKEIATEGTLNITYNTAKQLTNKQYRIIN